jgi:hypothetical protein
MMPKVLEMLNGKEPENWQPNTKLLYATAGANGWSHQQVKDLILFNFKRASTKDLTYTEFYKTLDWLGNLTPGTVTAERDKNTLDMFEC